MRKKLVIGGLLWILAWDLGATSRQERGEDLFFEEEVHSQRNLRREKAEGRALQRRPRKEGGKASLPSLAREHKNFPQKYKKIAPYFMAAGTSLWVIQCLLLMGKEFCGAQITEQKNYLFGVATMGVFCLKYGSWGVGKILGGLNKSKGWVPIGVSVLFDLLIYKRKAEISILQKDTDLRNQWSLFWEKAVVKKRETFVCFENYESPILEVRKKAPSFWEKFSSYFSLPEEEEIDTKPFNPKVQPVSVYRW